MFDRHRIPYEVIGGQAVLRYGRPRLTDDSELPANGKRLKRRKKTRIGGATVRYAAIKDVLIHKLVAHRPLGKNLQSDLDDTENTLTRKTSWQH